MLDLVLTISDASKSFLTNTDATFNESKHIPPDVLHIDKEKKEAVYNFDFRVLNL